MQNDRYTRGVLTIIALALVYLCIVLTPLPPVHAQRGLRPGDDTGPAQVVVVGWRTTDRPAVQVADSVPLRVSGDVGVNGLVQVDLPANKVTRVALVGWEDNAPNPAVPGVKTGEFQSFNARQFRRLPVAAWAP